MRRATRHSGQSRRILLFCLFLAFGPECARGIEIDRLIAAVNGNVITEGDLRLARNLSTVLSAGSLSETDSRKEQIDRLIDQELMRQELENFRGTPEPTSGAQRSEKRVQARLQSLRDAYAGKGGIPVVLQQLGLQESELIAYLKHESAILAFVNFRFRPFAVISEEESKAYYDGRLAEQFKKSGLELPPLPQIAGKIEEILREEKINAMLDQWIENIRRNSRIEYFEDIKELD